MLLSKLHSGLEQLYSTKVERLMAIDIALLQMEVSPKSLKPFLETMVDLSEAITKEGSQLLKHIQDPSQLTSVDKKVFKTDLIKQIEGNPSWLDAFRKSRLAFYKKHCPSFFKQVGEYIHG